MQRLILVVRFGSLGDVILSSATVLNLKLAYPDSHLVYLTKELFQPVVNLFDGVDEVVTISDEASTRTLLKTLYELDNRRFEILVDLHGNFRSWLTRSIVNARQKVVYPKRRLDRWRATRRKKNLPADYPHTIDQYNSILAQLSHSSPCRRPMLPPLQLSRELQRLVDTDRRLIMIAPGAAHPTKAWPRERFIELAHSLRRSTGARICWAVTSEERDSADREAFSGDPDITELVDCPADRLAAVAGKSDLVIANDSGIAHLASAVGTPVLAIFGPTHPVLGFAPRGFRDRVMQVEEECRPCSLHGQKACFREARYCFTKISAASVAESAIEMLEASTDLAPGLFVDRDGTIIVDKHYLADPDGVELIDGSAEALKAAQSKGYRIVMVSNQSGVARGYHPVDAVERVNARIMELLSAQGVQLDGVHFCPHHSRKGRVPEFTVNCNCRKPGAGMVERAALDLRINPRKSVVVGDSIVDIRLGRVIGGRSILVRTGYGKDVERNYRPALENGSVSVADNLLEAVRLL